MIDAVLDVYQLTLRSLREVVRQPAFEIQNYFIPLFFFAVTVGAIGNVSARAFGVENYQGFQMPVAILQGAAGGSGGAILVLLLVLFLARRKLCHVTGRHQDRHRR